ncbi:hypothetical protein [Streptomyces sp. LBL]|uniref:hypothetical protein n=1 Tax=Streptomyces sp. LBL TaxID=2940562 RepID=UPI0024748CFE|nr:hypothetical protein [Streptomyces sp. LBL]
MDGHKNTHTPVAVDPLGKRLAELAVAARPLGHLKALAWLHGFGPVLVAVEDCRHLTAGSRPTCSTADTRWYGCTPG